MKKISIVIPTYNEEANVVDLSAAIIEVMKEKLSQYDYEIIFIDNHSQDNTQLLLTGLCAQNSKIKAIFNVKNFGQFNSPYYGLTQITGDCAILVCADFQDPLSLLPTFVQEWEKGSQIVIGVKTKSQENKVMYCLRTLYYKMLKKLSSIEQISHFTGFGLYDKTFIETLRQLHDPQPFLRSLVAELGGKRTEIPYMQAKRKAGRTKNNFSSLYNAAMIGLTTYTKLGLRLATFLGFTVGILCIIIALIYLIIKIFHGCDFEVATLFTTLGLFFLGSIQLIFIGFIGEYVWSIHHRLLNRPLVIEEKRLNFEKA